MQELLWLGLKRLLDLLAGLWSLLYLESPTRSLELEIDYDSGADWFHYDSCSNQTSQNCSSQNYDSMLGQTHFCPAGCFDAFLFPSG